MDQTTNPNQGAVATDKPTEAGREIVRDARSQAQQVAQSATDDAKQVAGTAKEQAALVADEVASQARGAVSDVAKQARSQAQAQTEQLAGALQGVKGQFDALLDGRPEDAGIIADYGSQASEKLGAVADRLQSGGISGLISDTENFARRRPGTFLLGATIAGFGVGRLIRSGKAANVQISEQSGNKPTGSANSAAFDLREPDQLAGYESPRS